MNFHSGRDDDDEEATSRSAPRTADESIQLHHVKTGVENFYWLQAIWKLLFQGGHFLLFLVIEFGGKFILQLRLLGSYNESIF